METVFDWLSVAIFAGLALLFLQRSVEEQPSDKIWQYLAPSVACAAGNWLGNEGHEIAAVLCLFVAVIYIFYVLRPHLPRR